VSRGEERKLYQESPQPGEEELARELGEFLIYVIKRKNFNSGTMRRDQHPKTVALLKARLEIDPGLPAQFRHGIFAQKPNYPCWIRLSNAAPIPAADHKKDIRGFAVKIMDVDGDKVLWQERHATTQDFLFLNTPAFLTRDTAQFFRFVKALNTSIPALLWFFLTHPKAFLIGFKAAQRFANLLEIPWFGETPFRLGPDLVVKSALFPRAPATSAIPPAYERSRNYLREAAAKTLAETEVLYDLNLQVQVDPDREPIDDAQAVWSEKLSPWQKVATLRIPKQEIFDPELNWLAENLSMNIWHTLPEHLPLGNVNRARRIVYLMIVEFRRTQNLLPPLEEPVAPPDFFAGTSLGDDRAAAVAAGGGGWR